jgi:hypothetical protein
MPPQTDQFGQGGIGATAAVEQAVDFVHDCSQGNQYRLAAHQPTQGDPL